MTEFWDDKNYKKNYNLLLFMKSVGDKKTNKFHLELHVKPKDTLVFN